jgi:hypothetical protein
MSATPTLVDDLPPALLEEWRARFVNRTMPYALQQVDGSYRWAYDACELETLTAHLRGELTLALASTNARGDCRWLCLDVDVPGMLRQLLMLRDALTEHELPGLVEASRRGGHLWLFFDAPLPAVAARYVLAKTLEAVSAEGVEVPAHERYPDLGGPGGLGHAMRLPLGIHRKTGQRYPLFDEEGASCMFPSLGRAVAFIVETPAISAMWAEAQWNAYHANGRAHGHHRQERRVESRATREGARHDAKTPGIASQWIGTRSAVIRWVDAEVSPLDLLADLEPASEMKRVGKGYLGWRPFHDDRAADENGRPGSPSFYVVQDRRYGWSWRCLSTNCAFSIGPHEAQLAPAAGTARSQRRGDDSRGASAVARIPISR